MSMTHEINIIEFDKIEDLQKLCEGVLIKRGKNNEISINETDLIEGIVDKFLDEMDYSYFDEDELERFVDYLMVGRFFQKIEG